MSAEALAQRFHYLYESLAPQFGYETRKDSAVAWEKVPEKNRKLMIAVCEQLLAIAPPEQAARMSDAVFLARAEEENGCSISVGGSGNPPQPASDGALEKPNE